MVWRRPARGHVLRSADRRGLGGGGVEGTRGATGAGGGGHQPKGAGSAGGFSKTTRATLRTGTTTTQPSRRCGRSTGSLGSDRICGVLHGCDLIAFEALQGQVRRRRAGENVDVGREVIAAAALHGV